MTGVLCATFVLENFLFAFLLALLGVLALVVCVLSLFIASRHRADVKKLERYVYVKETWVKPSNCANSDKNEAANGANKNATKKPRHGKKNKQARTNKEAAK